MCANNFRLAAFLLLISADSPRVDILSHAYPESLTLNPCPRHTFEAIDNRPTKCIVVIYGMV